MYASGDPPALRDRGDTLTWRCGSGGSAGSVDASSSGALVILCLCGQPAVVARQPVRAARDPCRLGLPRGTAPRELAATHRPRPALAPAWRAGS